MKNSKYYVAYGSNLHKEQMSFRCPGAKVIAIGKVKDYKLVYRGSKTGAYATIIPSHGDYVPVAIWEINADHERRLDLYEGYPTFYYKKNISVVLENGKTIEAMVYIMFDEALVGRPSMAYLETCAQGYLDCGLDMVKFEESIVNNFEELGLKVWPTSKVIAKNYLKKSR